jgi:hypothetical protein
MLIYYAPVFKPTTTEISSLFAPDTETEGRLSDPVVLEAIFM